MRQKLDWFLIFFISHCIAFTVTYGHAYTTARFDDERRLISAFMSALFWPLYWSVEAWK